MVTNLTNFSILIQKFTKKYKYQTLLVLIMYLLKIKISRQLYFHLLRILCRLERQQKPKTLAATQAPSRTILALLIRLSQKALLKTTVTLKNKTRRCTARKRLRNLDHLPEVAVELQCKVGASSLINNNTSAQIVQDLGWKMHVEAKNQKKYLTLARAETPINQRY